MLRSATHLLLVSAWLALSSTGLRAADGALRVDADLPGGNIIVDKVSGDDVHLHHDLRDTNGPWFYWAFRVRGGQGRRLTFHFTRGNVIGRRGPAVSGDGGKTWRWLGPGAVRGASFHFAIPAGAADVRFAFAFPYTGENLRAFLKGCADSPHLKVATLCRSRKRRDVELLRLGRLDGKSDYRIALTCRHHACEMMASYELEGIMEEVLGKGDDGTWLRKHVEFFIVPLVDKDGVEDGDQGKNRKPHDHNRDYEGRSIYPEVRAIRERLPAWSGGKLRIALDLHCPARNDSTIFLVGGPDEAVWKEIGRFGGMLEAVRSGPLVYKNKDNMPIGRGWNTAAIGRKAFARWAATLPGVTLATTLELPYASVDATEVTDATARAFGRRLAKAFRKYLEAPAR